VEATAREARQGEDFAPCVFYVGPLRSRLSVRVVLDELAASGADPSCESPN